MFRLLIAILIAMPTVSHAEVAALDWKNLPNNWESSPDNWENSSKNWATSPNNWEYSPNAFGTPRIIRDESSKPIVQPSSYLPWGQH